MITWRPAALLAAGAVVVAVLPWPWAGVAVLAAAVATLCVLDAALAAAPGDVVLRREGARQVRLDDTTEVTLVVTNTGVRPLRAQIRDAWVPSAGATPYAQRVDLDPDESARLVTTLYPTRRGDPASAASSRQASVTATASTTMPSPGHGSSGTTTAPAASATAGRQVIIAGSVPSRAPSRVPRPR